jgi:hypothetical protein
MAEPREFPNPIAQIEVDSLELTGWSAPPGWYGYVPAAGVGIIVRCGVDKEAGIAGLRRLGSPELDSRNPNFEGRRMIRMDGGYVILNYMRYRDKDHTASERQQRLRDRRKALRVASVTPRNRNDVTPRDGNGVTPRNRNDVTPRDGNGVTPRNITQADADADAIKNKKPCGYVDKSKSAGLRPISERMPNFKKGLE